ncbi:MAG: hypothetical protein D6814_07175, partial [Calditrichaeota bacterium]
MRCYRRFFLTIFALGLLLNSSLAQSLAPELSQKFHPDFRQLIREQLSTPGAQGPASTENVSMTLSENGQPEYGAIIYFKDQNPVPPAGLHVNSAFSNFVTTYASLDELIDLAGSPEVVFIEPGSINYPMLDVSIPLVGAHLLHAGFLNDTPYKGKGAIVVIYDTGIDWKHLDFRNPQDTTKSRILFIWDQT